MKRSLSWRIGAVVLCVVGLVLLAGCDDGDFIQPNVESSRMDVMTFAVAGRPHVTIETTNGTVTVQGVQGQIDVRVTATLRSHGTTLGEANRRLEQLTIAQSQDADRIVVRYRAESQPEDARQHSGVDFAVAVPVDADVSATGTNGKQSAENIHGSLTLDTTNGAISVSGAVGSVTLHTTNGAVDLSSSQGTFRLATTNGAVRLANVEGGVDAETSNGTLSFSGRLVGQNHSLRTTNGGIVVAIPRTSSLQIDARTSVGSISTGLAFAGDMEGKSWSAALNPPATSTLTVRTTNGSIRIEELR